MILTIAGKWLIVWVVAFGTPSQHERAYKHVATKAECMSYAFRYIGREPRIAAKCERGLFGAL